MKEISGTCVQIDSDTIHTIDSNEIATTFWSFSPTLEGNYEGEVTFICMEINNERSINIQYFGECKVGHLRVITLKITLYHFINGRKSSRAFV